MGGVIAASLAFYIMYIGKSRNINLKYGNPFIDEGKNSIGVVTFGSPLFLNNLYAGIKMKELVSQFINIKEDYDFIPEIIDLIDKKQKIYPELLNIIRKMKFDKDDIDFLKSYLSKKNKFMENINKFKKIPFGYYYMMETKCYSLSIVNENTFNTFYYYIKSDSIDLIPNEISYGKLSLNSNNNFDKLTLDFLEKKEVQLELIKIIRRNIKSKDHNYQKEIKGIIRFKLPFIVHNAISPDIINKINLITKGEKIYEINYKDIYYSYDVDITAYIDGLRDNIDKVIITNSFGGEIQAQHILNIQGSGPTRKMLKENIEKIFLIPFFKIFEIFYISFDDEKKYNDLKEKNFGKNFENLKLLKPFEKQIQTLNELLYLTRPDILWKLEKQFIEKYVNNKLDNDQMIFFNNMLERYYNQAMKVLLEQKINCLSPESGSIAEKVFSSKKIEKGYEKKLFMCNRSCFNYDNIILNKLDNSYVKDFFMENLINPF